VPDDARRDPTETSQATGPSRHIAAYFEDPALWPILFILVVHVALGGALVLLSALRGGSLPALAALAVLLTLSLDAVRRAQRRRRVAIWIATLWALSALTAVVAAKLGVL
jgi:hypothetical protein